MKTRPRPQTLCTLLIPNPLRLPIQTTTWSRTYLNELNVVHTCKVKPDENWILQIISQSTNQACWIIKITSCLLIRFFLFRCVSRWNPLHQLMEIVSYRSTAYVLWNVSNTQFWFNLTHLLLFSERKWFCFATNTWLFHLIFN